MVLYWTRLLVVAWVASVLGPKACFAWFQTIDFSAYHDLRLQTLEVGNVGWAHLYPEGSLLFDGVPFITPVGGRNAWSSGGFPNNPPGQQQITISVGLPGVDRVYTLMNTMWGERVSDTYASIEFIGSAGAYHRVDLDGNDDIRDWLYGGYTNAVNGITTVNVFSVGTGILNVESRLDMQTFVLPSTFLSQELEAIRITDFGAPMFQRILLYGVTVSYVPEPGASVLCLSGAGAVFGLFRRRKGHQVQPA